MASTDSKKEEMSGEIAEDWLIVAVNDKNESNILVQYFIWKITAPSLIQPCL